ncbi:hypothetical protein HOLleu_38585 [Holothuria leucospilota]|uniref:Uncharacterized protein n=1 Tax=Holothuria leucospilota TaxID=206669 RepID=A0A9Q0YH66_HOLLE|nr:hypothetical protein HOLleu_38585 [Holothuria leucospilota]
MVDHCPQSSHLAPDSLDVCFPSLPTMWVVLSMEALVVLTPCTSYLPPVAPTWKTQNVRNTLLCLKPPPPIKWWSLPVLPT